jgi:integrase
MKKKAESESPTRGRRGMAEKAAGRWRLSIRELHESRNGYSWKTWLVQGWKDERGRWVRRKFKDRRAAEAFLATKRLENMTQQKGLLPVLTSLSLVRLREAEMAVEKLEAVRADLPDDEPMPTLLEAVAHYSDHLRRTRAVEKISMREARIQCFRDKAARGMRHRSVVEADNFMKAFEAWLRLRPRYTSKSFLEDWTPPVQEVTTADVVEFLAGLRGKNGLIAKPKTRNNGRAILRSFFGWCIGMENDTPMPGVMRRWHVENPAAAVPVEQVEAGVPEVLSVQAAAELMVDVERTRGGWLVPFFSLALFAGIRPKGELRKLAAHEGLNAPHRSAGGRPLMDFEREVITIPAEVSKTGRRRVLTIQKNLIAWLKAYPGPVFPVGHTEAIAAIRRKHGLGHDVLRHSFISYHVAAFGSKGRTALEAGNSETIIDKHYLNLPTEAEGRAFFSIMPSA